MSKFGFTQKEAGRITSVSFIIPLIIAPLSGALIDKVGMRVSLLFASSAFLFMCHGLFTVMSDCSKCYTGVFPLVLIGFSYSIYMSALWPMIPLVVPEQALGVAYGFTNAV